MERTGALGDQPFEVRGAEAIEQLLTITHDMFRIMDTAFAGRIAFSHSVRSSSDNCVRSSPFSSNRSKG